MFSVIIPVFNKEHSIATTLTSVLHQTYKYFEIIVINDGSNDNTLSVISQFKDDRLKVITQVNQGVSIARNKGVSESKYNLIALLDGDDIWDKNFLNEMYGFIQLNPEDDLFGCAYSFGNSEKNIFTPDLGLGEHFKDGHLDYFSAAKVNTLFTCSTVVFRKGAFNDLGKFDTTLSKGEDIDLWIRFALNRKVAFLNKPLAIYRLNSGNRASNQTTNPIRSLIYNLDRYKNYEAKDPVFKEFLDNWRLAHIHNYLKGNRNEVKEIYTLLNTINLDRYSLIWKCLRYTPKILQPTTFKLWTLVKNKAK